MNAGIQKVNQGSNNSFLSALQVRFLAIMKAGTKLIDIVF